MSEGYNELIFLKGLEAYGQKEAMAVHFKTTKEIATRVGSQVTKIIKQW